MPENLVESESQESVTSSQNTITKGKISIKIILAAFLFLSLGSACWLLLSYISAWGGGSGSGADLQSLLTGLFIFSVFFSGLVAFLANRLFGKRLFLSFSLVFGLFPLVIILSFSFLNFAQSLTPEARKIQEDFRIREEKERTEAAKINALKASLQFREPSYHLGFQSIDEKLYNENEIQVVYTGCLTISEYRAPLSYQDLQLGSASTKESVDIGGNVIASFIPYETNGYYVTFEYDNVAFKIFYYPDLGNDYCGRQPISKEELIKIVQSIVQQ